MNGYAYANNSPLTFSDPDGLRACSNEACTTFITPKKPAKKPVTKTRSMPLNTAKTRKESGCAGHNGCGKAGKPKAKPKSMPLNTAKTKKESGCAGHNGCGKAGKPKPKPSPLSTKLRKESGCAGHNGCGAAGKPRTPAPPKSNSCTNVLCAVGDHFKNNWRTYAKVATAIGGLAAAAACGASVICAVGVGVLAGGAAYNVENSGTKNWNAVGFVGELVEGGVGGAAAGGLARGAEMAENAAIKASQADIDRIVNIIKGGDQPRTPMPWDGKKFGTGPTRRR
jgi:hypothetical protein